MDISVVIPVYNSEKTIRECIESIVVSDFSGSFEIIVADDGSTDSSTDRIKGLPVEIIRQKNQGAAAARNRGAKQAKSDIILFVDSDMVFYKDTLKRIHALMKDHNIDYLSIMYDITPANNRLIHRYKALADYCYNYEFIFPEERKKGLITNVDLGGIEAYRKSVFFDVGGFDETIKGADVEREIMLQKMMEKGYRLVGDPSIRTKHHFPDFRMLVNNYFYRTMHTMELVVEKGYSQPYLNNNLLRVLLAPLAIFSLVFSLAAAPSMGSQKVFFLPAILFIAYIYSNFGLFNLAYKEYGAVFTVYSIIMNMMFGSIIAFAGATGVIKKKINMTKTLYILKNIFITQTPIYVIFFVTSACNARCRMCFNWERVDKADKKWELTLDEIKKTFDSFSDIQQLTISGGEPFLRGDLPEILGYISKKNCVQNITVSTNGILTDKIYEQIKKTLDKISGDTNLLIALSLLGIGERHDSIMQVDGAFEGLLQTYKKLHELKKTHKNLSIDIGICCNAFNIDEMEGILDYCSRQFLDCTISMTLVRGNTREKKSKDITPQQYRKVKEYYEKSTNLKKNNKPFARLFNALIDMVNEDVMRIIAGEKAQGPCYCGSKLIVIQSNGDVFPCEYLDKKSGNLRDTQYDIRKTLKTVWNKEALTYIRRGRCSCTWECALINNIVCNPRRYPQFLKKLTKNFIAENTINNE